MNKIIVKIANQEYTIIGKEEKDYILSLASHVDEQITKASEKTPKSNIVTPVVLASINIADQYFKSLEENKRLSDIIETHNFGIINEKDKNSQSLREKDGYIKDIENQLASFEQKNNNSLLEIERLNKEIMNKENEIEDLNILINSFQNHIYELQLEINNLIVIK